MRKHTRTLILGVSAIIAVGTLSACSGDSSTEATSTQTTAPAATAKPFPASAKYIADMKSADGKTMTIGVAVDGADVTAYACNGTDDEAWFFGNQADGKIDITSKFKDTLKASFDGSDVKGDLMMNGITYNFAAPAVEAPAGMYTADLNGARASWVVRPNGSAIGVQFNGGVSSRDFEQAEVNILKDQQFRDQVRNKRKLQQAAQLVDLQNGRGRSTINGQQVIAVVVVGNTRFG
jgi:hypothetical protein